MKKEVAFTTLLKLLELDQKKRRAEFKKLKSGGGFPYWQPLREMLGSAAAPGANWAALSLEMEKLCSGHRREYNKKALSVFFEWAQDRNCEISQELPLLSVPFGSAGIQVRLAPDITLKLNGNLVAMSIWATTKPLLSKKTLSAALLFMKNSYGASGVSGVQFSIFDTIAGHVFNEMDILASATAVLKEKQATFDSDWSEIPVVPSTSSKTPTKGPIPPTAAL